MEPPISSAKTDFAHPEQHTSPDAESRGRKRRRDPISITLTRPNQSPAESCTLRGRCRHRSSSRLGITSCSSSRARKTTSSPSKRRLLGVIVLRAENHRRGQSPSRSRSPGNPQVEAAGKRRRQRTRSRSRNHDRRQASSPVGQSQKAPFGLVYLHPQDKPREED